MPRPHAADEGEEVREPARIPPQKKTEQPSLAQTAAQQILERDVKRYIAMCPFECAFNERKPKALKLTDNAAEVESVRHVREAHPEALVKQVTAKRKRRVIEDDFELVEG
jgi:hypothetical protein